MRPEVLTGLPVDDVLDDVVGALDRERVVVLQAPTGAGKTTHVPLALLDRPWSDGRILVLEPRRLAARAAARRMAYLLGEDPGDTVGYVTRDERVVSDHTRIEVVTEGVLVRRVQRQPGLPGIAAVLFDEFHERSLDADLGLAFVLEVATALREDLRLVVMSATLEGKRIARLVGDAPVVESRGRQYPVETHHVDRPVSGRIERPVARAIVDACSTHPDGHVLVFLPGAREIRRTERELRSTDLGRRRDVVVAPLFGALPPDEQDRALDPVPDGVRKIVLATDIAETSLTIEGVRIVVDSGLTRAPRFNSGTGMSRLETVRISKASADQRRGRAGRTEPGVCYRLWPEREHHARAPYTEPEIAQADLAGFALEVAAWGADVDDLRLLDPPPDRAYGQARTLLTRLGALDARGAISDHGRELVGLPLHPRLGHMILAARDDGLDGLACEAAALLADRDVLSAPPRASCADLALRVRLLRGDARAPSGAHLRHGTLHRARREARRLRRATSARDDRPSPEDVGRVLARAYPDRVGRRREGARGEFVLSNGRGAFLPDADALAGEDFVVVAEVSGGGREARIHVAAAVDLDELRDVLADRVETIDVVAWDDRHGDVVRAREERLDELVLRETMLDSPSAAATTTALIEGICREGLDLLPWSRALSELRARADFLRRTLGGPWPDLSEQTLVDELEEWLAPFLTGARKRADLAQIPLTDALRARIGWENLGTLDELAPERIEVPSGSHIRLDYRSGDVPVLAVRIQEMFGAVDTPTVADGRVRVMLHLLSPAQRPVQVTDDLAGFWHRTYPEVRSELRGRYPKHHWPEDPLRARPTPSGLPRDRV